MFVLKEYQQDALNALRTYLRRTAQSGDADDSFYQTTRDLTGRGVVYEPVPKLPGLPYVCVRIPTGGGKTVVACHSLAIVAEELLRQERCVALWLTPTKTIRDQTLTALRNRKHPYRRALDSTLGAHVTVMDLSEALHVQPSTVDGETVIIVSTLAALRVEDTDGRKVYEQNGQLGNPFKNVPAEALAGLERYEGTDKPIPSLANVLALRHPVVIVDEAHNARTPLSFDTLERFKPSCIVEFTATPAQRPKPSPSNVLYHVSAFQLKSDDMIKLPIHLEEDTNWEDVVRAAVARRSELEAAATAEKAATGEYIRPIALVQAQPNRTEGESVSVQVVKESLLSMGVPLDHIAIETGELGEVSKWESEHRAKLSDESCPIRFIITVDKLREGWDCPFAYVLCSVREMGAQGAVEQILGRILRMPRAVRKVNNELNYAYAFASSRKFGDAAKGLADALVANGFTRFEAASALAPQAQFGFEENLFAPREEETSPAQRGKRLSVPALSLWVDGELEQVEETHFLQSEWRLSECDACLDETEFPYAERAAGEFDLDVGQDGLAHIERTGTAFISDLQRKLAMLVPPDFKTNDQAVMWLDRHIPHPDITQPQTLVFLMRMVEHLTCDRGIEIEELSRRKMALRDAAAAKIDGYRRKVVKTAYQEILFGTASKALEVSARRVFTYDPERYPVGAVYEGPVAFRRHYYKAIGAMNDEEARCAQVIDSLPEVDCWVRNLERRPDTSFWLQTSTDKFYPDFVAQLADGRVLVVEYKGAHIIDSDDTREKRMLGNLWSAKSDGACIFLLVGVADFESAVRQAVRSVEDSGEEWQKGSYVR